MNGCNLLPLKYECAIILEKLLSKGVGQVTQHFRSCVGLMRQHCLFINILQLSPNLALFLLNTFPKFILYYEPLLYNITLYNKF